MCLLGCSGWSLVYSGDTRPSDALTQLGGEGGGCTVLIHEATFDEEKANEAVKKKHSTVNEALMVT